MSIQGLPANLDHNIYHFAQLTALGSTEAIAVHGAHLTFVHKVTGNVTIEDQGSLDGTNWFNLDVEKAHTQSGIDGHFYAGRAIRYVRSTVTSISSDVTVDISVMCF